MNTGLSILVGANVRPDPNSGAAGTVLATNQALSGLGHNVESFWADDLGRRIPHGNLHNLLELPLAYRALVRERMAGRSFDVVQLSQPHGYLAGRWILSRSVRPLMVWRSHGLESKVDAALARHSPPSSGWLRARLRAVMRSGLDRAQRQAMIWCDGAVVPCADDKSCLVDAHGADPEKIAVIWHGVPDEYIDSPVSYDPGRWTRLLHVSQLSVNKGPMVMHAVAGRILAERPEASMTWVCPENLHGEMRATLPEAVRDRVAFRGWIGREELMREYDSHGLFLFPTLAEGAAKVVMESMARGMCVISSDTSGPRDYIESGVNGVLVPVGDSAAMAGVASQLVADPAAGQAMGQRARETASLFRWGRCASELVEFYRYLKQRTEGVAQ